jgi:adenosine deaminase
MKLLREQDIVLELCPSSNLSTRAVSGWDELKHVIRTFLDRKVKITINTDGPYLLETDMQRELVLLREHGILDDAEIDQCLAWANEASFLRGEHE